MRRIQPDADIHDANTVCLKALEYADDVRMFLCAFEDFSNRADVESMFEKVALVLTDPPYNTRREAGASNSDYDKLSLSSIKEAADVIKKLLRPHGHAFIFCSFKQVTEWRSVLESAGGGSSLKLPAVPGEIIRNNTSVHSAGRFLYRRVNAYKIA
jgi:predicted RNA methylase